MDMTETDWQQDAPDPPTDDAPPVAPVWEEPAWVAATPEEPWYATGARPRPEPDHQWQARPRETEGPVWAKAWDAAWD